MSSTHEKFILKKIKELEAKRDMLFKDSQKPPGERQYSEAIWHRTTGMIDILYIVLTSHDSKYAEKPFTKQKNV